MRLLASLSWRHGDSNVPVAFVSGSATTSSVRFRPLPPRRTCRDCERTRTAVVALAPSWQESVRATGADASPWRGFVCEFDGVSGRPLRESRIETLTRLVSGAEESIVLSTDVDWAPGCTLSAAEKHEGSVVFGNGTWSSGASDLSQRGTESISRLLIHTGFVYEQSERARITIVYENLVRKSVVVAHEARDGIEVHPFLNSAPLDAKDIEGRWMADNMRYVLESNSWTQETIQRNYDGTNSSNPSLLRLPLLITVVSKPLLSLQEVVSFGCGWSPNNTRRFVCIRRHNAGGNFALVSAREEKKMQLR
ncbi:hypothetical protein FVE85_8973 [Porphyridium purpureum]|uniref:Uncharacterized protein n=1 Tax=Porphyridium purpureum TaxID=35688 RepID=A0A5J4YJ06_PORPP|nr:hypothetical protein FVE85_8973 [Porphyridium purpureum]|eukprot:POR9014..scf226_27